MAPSKFDVIPTNSTSPMNSGSGRNRDGDVILYILIVLGASIFLLLIPLMNFVTQRCKRRMRRKKRRKQAEKLHARRLAEKELLKQRLYEKQIANLTAQQLQLDGVAAVLNVPTWSPINQGSCLQNSTLVNPKPHSPVRSEAKEVSANDLDISEFQKETWAINKGFHSSSSTLTMPLRKSASELYLPRDPALVALARRKYSEDGLGSGETPIIDSIHRCALAEKMKPKEKEMAVKKNKIARRHESETGVAEMRKTKHDVTGHGNEAQMITSKENITGDATEKLAKSSPSLKRPESSNASSTDSACEVSKKMDTDAFESDDYDDIYDAVYESNDEESNEDPIYENIDYNSESDSDHIYSNIDELSDSDSHVYTNIDFILDEKFSDEFSDEYDYENVEIVRRKSERSTDGDASETSSVSYENLDFLDGNEIETENGRYIDYENKTPPPIIPRRIPLASVGERVVDLKPKVQRSSSVA